MVFKLPINGKWSQTNQVDLLGSINYSRNIDTDIPGVVRLAQRTRYFGQTSSGNFLDAYAILFYRGEYWVCSSRMFKAARALNSFAADALSNTPSSGPITDGTVWGDAIYVSKTSRVSKLTGTTWTQDWSSADFTNTGSSFPHPIEPNCTNANLLVGDGNKVKTIDSSGTIGDGSGGSQGITFPANYCVAWIRRGANTNYIGLRAIDNASGAADGSLGGKGAIAIWDGLSTTLGYNYLIPISAAEPMSGCVDDLGDLYSIWSDGRLMKLVGAGFQYEAELPMYRNFKYRLNWGGALTMQRRVLNRGMGVIRGRIHVIVDTNGDTSPVYRTEVPSGLWVYDKENQSFAHRYSASSSNATTDFGQGWGTTTVSALSPVFEGSDPSASVGGVVIFGMRNSDAVAATTLRSIVSVTTGENRGFFTTAALESPNATDKEIAVWCKYRGIEAAADKIIFKYRTGTTSSYPLGNIAVTWTSTTTFTTTDSQFANVVSGDEITVILGRGSGCLAHVSSISNNAGTYTVTLDEAVSGVSNTDTGYVAVEQWTRLDQEIGVADTLGYKRIAIPVTDGAAVELKVEMRGEGGRVGVESLEVINKVQKPHQ